MRTKNECSHRFITKVLQHIQSIEQKHSFFFSFRAMNKNVLFGVFSLFGITSAYYNKVTCALFQILKHQAKYSLIKELFSLFFLLIINSYSLSSFKLKSLLLLHSFAFVLAAGYYYSRENERRRVLLFPSSLSRSSRSHHSWFLGA